MDESSSAPSQYVTVHNELDRGENRTAVFAAKHVEGQARAELAVLVAAPGPAMFSKTQLLVIAHAITDLAAQMPD